ncbi:hypothetical protein QYE76_010396 [Lolium multiflorum]|uniref:Ribonuclease H1 N-terminal domain-containing protein n=1 Tax=Lolium multiflorum TaxID=4521 RepID=A0AAD8TX50_LOLMU|nr:hypothetical protein QYE76_010396 [Lolium multiflorum]
MFKHVIDFPFIKQSADSIKEAFYVLHHLKGFVVDAEMMSLPPSQRDPIKMAGEINDADLRVDFHRIPVKLSEIILENVSNRSGLLHQLRGLCKRDIEERLHRQEMTYYVMFEGWVPGVYKEWEECKKQVHKFSGNCYKGYPTRHEAVAKWRKHQSKKSKMMTFVVLSLLLTIVAATSGESDLPRFGDLNEESSGAPPGWAASPPSAFMGLQPGNRRSRNGEEEEPHRRCQFYQRWRRRQILLESSEGERSNRSSPSSGAAGAKPGDWIASSITKRDEKRSRSLGLISSDEGNVIFPVDEGSLSLRPRKPNLALLRRMSREAAPGMSSSPEAADIPAAALDKIPNNSPANGVSMTLATHQLTRELLEKGKGAMTRMHLMIFPKLSQNKTLGQLIDAFAVNTKEVIEVFKRTSRTYGALLAFQLMMGHGFKADIEKMSKELSKDQDGQFIDLGIFKTSAIQCARQLLDLVSSEKTPAGLSGGRPRVGQWTRSGRLEVGRLAAKAG